MRCNQRLGLAQNFRQSVDQFTSAALNSIDRRRGGLFNLRNTSAASVFRTRRTVFHSPAGQYRLDCQFGNRHRLAADFHDRAVRQHHLQTFDVPANRAVLQPVAARGIDGNHAADGRDSAVGRIGPEHAALALQMGVEYRMDHTRLQTNRLGVGAENPPHVAREIDHDAATQRFASQTRAGAARLNRQLFLRRVFHDRRNIGGGSRSHHGLRFQFVDTGIAGVKLQEDVVAANIAGDHSAKVFLNALPLGIHFSGGREQGAGDRERIERQK